MNALSHDTSATSVFRSVFVSDFHLGVRASKTSRIAGFLDRIEAETLYLVGDIFDIWHGGKIHWGDAEEAVLRMIDHKRRNGTRVVYLTGNHDKPLRVGRGSEPDGWERHDKVIHQSADGKRYLVLHGDQCDPRLMRWHAVTRFGSRVDALARSAIGGLRRWRDLPEAHRTFLERGVDKVRSTLAMGERFERRLLGMAEAEAVDGVISGHSHQAALRSVAGMTFANCGDWVDSCTALLERLDGSLSLVAFDRTLEEDDRFVPETLTGDLPW